MKPLRPYRSTSVCGWRGRGRTSYSSGSVASEGYWEYVSVSERCLGYRRETSASSGLSGRGQGSSFSGPHFREGM